TLPIFRAARQAVQQGAIGEPILISSQKSYKYGAKRPWFYRERKTYGGTIPWVGIHALDYMEWVSGQKYTHVAAYEGNKAHSQSPGCEDHAGLLIAARKWRHGDLPPRPLASRSRSYARGRPPPHRRQ